MALDTPGPAFLDALAARLPGAVGPVPAALLAEPRGRFTGRAAALVRPRGVDEVAAAVALAAAHRVGIIPYGGGTGLVGGQTAGEGLAPILISLERMAAIRAIDTGDNVAVVEAGAILASVHDAVEAEGRIFPLSLASEGSARIGGLLATNAGGLNVIRYGNARDLCLGVEAVLPDGQILHGLKRLRKDNTGYDLRHLLVGSEGTLGIITAASLRLFAKPEEQATALVAVASPDAALALLRRLEGEFEGGITAFELIHRQSFAFLAEAMPDVPQPWTGVPEWAVLIELAGSRRAAFPARLEEALAAALEDGGIADALIAQSDQQRADFWQIRESIPEANRRIGSVSSHDISVPVSLVPEFIAKGGPAIAALDPALRINCFGHLGDGNLHYNVFPAPGRKRDEWRAMRPAIKAAVHDLTHALGGSVSAEHGVGRLKTEDLVKYSDPAKLSAMRAIKAALDPHGIMNPGAVLAQS